jgi:hypothetical protein
MAEPTCMKSRAIAKAEQEKGKVVLKGALYEGF